MVNSSLVEAVMQGDGTIDDPVEVSAEVRNPSNFGADGFFVRFTFHYDDGEPIIVSMGPYHAESMGSTLVRTTQVLDRPGDYQVSVVVDHMYNITETNETNNVGNASFTVFERPPLVWNLEPEEGDVSVEEGGQLVFSASVMRGSRYLLGNWTLDGAKVGNHPSYTFSADFTGTNSSEGSPKVLGFIADPGSLFEGEKAEAWWRIEMIDVDRPPVTTFSPSDEEQSVTEGQNKSFVVSYSDPDSDPALISWYVDGNLTGNTTSFTFFTDHTGPNSSMGSPFIISVNVTSNDHHMVRSWNLTVTDVDRPPTVSFFPAEGEVRLRENSSLEFSFALSDPDDDAFVSEWRYLDIELDNRSSVEVNATGKGLENNTVFEVAVTVVSGGYILVRSWNVTFIMAGIPDSPTVSEPPKGVVITSPLKGFEYKIGQIVVLSAIDSDDRELNYTWEVDGAIQYGERIELSGLTIGIYEVLLNVSAGEAWITMDTNFTIVDPGQVGEGSGEEDTEIWPILLAALAVLVLLAAISYILTVRLRPKKDTVPKGAQPPKEEAEDWGE